jgi:hypothetical protein
MGTKGEVGSEEQPGRIQGRDANLRVGEAASELDGEEAEWLALM